MPKRKIYPTDRYTIHLVESILPDIDYIRLQQSYETEDKAYAKGVLHILHEAAALFYGKEKFELSDFRYPPLMLPGVIHSIEDGKADNLCLALISLQGREGRVSTNFLTCYGLLSDQADGWPPAIDSFMRERYMPTIYSLTMDTPYPDGAPLSPAVRDVMNTFRQYGIDLRPSHTQHVLLSDQHFEDLEQLGEER